jgi:hypothetical protein
LEDALWTTLYTDKEIQIIEEIEKLDKEDQKAFEVICILVEE